MQQRASQREQRSNWQAWLNLGFEKKLDRTVLTRRQHKGPLVVQKPFYPEGAPCHVYILHPPGGVVGGDQLTIEIKVNQSAHALITTPAAGKFYRSDGRIASLQQTLVVEQGGILEWLPQEAIFFNDCRVNTVTRVNLAQGAKFIGWEIGCLGRPASDEMFTAGHIRQHLEIWRENKPLVIERARLEGGGDVLYAPWGLASYTVSGTLLITPSGARELELARSVTSNNDVLFSATLMEDVLVCRYLGHQGEHARQYFSDVWALIRPELLQRKACPPRIWKT